MRVTIYNASDISEFAHDAEIECTHLEVENETHVFRISISGDGALFVKSEGDITATPILKKTIKVSERTPDPVINGQN